MKKFCFISIRMRLFDIGMLFPGYLIECINKSLFESACCPSLDLDESKNMKDYLGKVAPDSF